MLSYCARVALAAISFRRAPSSVTPILSKSSSEMNCIV